MVLFLLSVYHLVLRSLLVFYFNTADPCFIPYKVESIFLSKVKNLDTYMLIREQINLLCNLRNKFDVLGLF